MSIVQGGYGYPLFHPSVYNYFIYGKYTDVCMLDNKVPDPLIAQFIKDVSFFQPRLCKYTILKCVHFECVHGQLDVLS